MDCDLQFDEDSRLIATTSFPYDEVDRDLGLFEPDSPEKYDLDAASEAIRRLLRWLFQNGPRNPEGLQIRAVVLCHIFLPELRPMTLTQMAGCMGKHKQSLGRWQDQFKRDFPNIPSSHFHNQ
jgi:hypothetical protein